MDVVTSGDIARVEGFIYGRASENQRNIGTQTVCQRELLRGFPLVLNVKSELQRIELRPPRLGARNALIGVVVLVFRCEVILKILDRVVGVGSERVGNIDNVRVIELVMRSEGECVAALVPCKVVGQCKSVLVERVGIGVAVGTNVGCATTICTYALHLDIGEVGLRVSTIDNIGIADVQFIVQLVAYARVELDACCV